MYDMAKRSLAFTVATGGLLLTGTGFSPAEAAVGVGAIPGMTQAQGGYSAQQTAPSSLSTPINVAGPDGGQADQADQAAQHAADPAGPAAQDDQAVPADQADQNGLAAPDAHRGLDAQDSHHTQGGQDGQDGRDAQDGPAGWDEAGAGPGASAQGVVSHSGGILAGNSVQVPINLPLNLCGDQVNVVALLNLNGPTKCENGEGHREHGERGARAGAEGGAGSTASGAIFDSGGIGSGNQIQIPVNVPINACGDQVNVIAVGNLNGPTECTIDEGEAPTSPPTTTPPTSCDTCTPPPSTSPTTTPSTSPTTTPPTTTPPSSCSSCSPPPVTPSKPAETTPPGHLASTGSESGAVLGVAGAALLGGIGLRTASKRQRRSH